MSTATSKWCRFPGEVLVELAMDALDRRRGAQHAGAVQAGQRLEVALGLRVEPDPAEAAVGDADEQRADRRVVEDVVGHVEQPFGGRGRAEALVERGGHELRHECSFRSRRTPAEAACRAAASVEPSAAPISS